MKTSMRMAVPTLLLIAGALVLLLAFEEDRPIAEPEQYRHVFRDRDGMRSWFLDTGALELKTEEESGIKYLEVYAKVAYTFTDNYDINHYWMQTANRRWQPIAATGCDKEGNVQEY